MHLDLEKPLSVGSQWAQGGLGQKGLICDSLLDLCQRSKIWQNFPLMDSQKSRAQGFIRQSGSFPVPNATTDGFSPLFNADVVTVLFLGVLLGIKTALAKGDCPFYCPDPELKLFRSNVCWDFLKRVNDIIRSSERDTHHLQRDVSAVFEVLEECKILFENSQDRRIVRLRELATCLDFFNAYWLARSRRRR